jgi:3-isopropylmalate/(R)-2-methylmalate dehydratase small subunit
MKFAGKAIKYGDHVDTDVIIPARYLNTSDPKELARHCMEDLDPDFHNKVTPGCFIAAGVNFGSGSSREHAPIAIKNSGVACVIAKSFARIFYRNAVNTGLPIIVSDLDIADGDELEADLDKGVLINKTRNTTGHFEAFPPFLQRIIEAGGLMQAMSGGRL